MSRYIDADKLLERMLDYFSPTEQANVAMSIPNWLVQDDIEDLIKTAPTADVKTIVKGEWLLNDRFGFKIYDCSNCGVHMEATYNYCPYCGADMR